MARVLGEAGRYVTDEAVRKQQQFLTALVVSSALAFVLAGLLLGCALSGVMIGRTHSLIIIPLTMLAVWLILRVGNRKLEKIERERMAMRKGAVGEAAVGFILGGFPEDFFVINDLATPYGDLDHVVIGATGVFVLDSKNWRGVVAADGKGELLLNGKPTEKPFIRQFVGRTMGIKDQVQMLVQRQRGLERCDPFFKPVFVFTSANVKANWGTTGSVHCIRDDQLWDYIVESKRSQKLKKHEVQAIARAFAALAKADAEFKATEAANSRQS